MIKEIEISDDICENPMPKYMKTQHSNLSGDYVAICEKCDYVCAYWECACELMHECKTA